MQELRRFAELGLEERPGSIVVRGLRVMIEGSPVVEHLSLALRPGEMGVLTGDHSSGRSSLLRALAGRQPITAGEAFIDGRPQDGRTRLAEGCAHLPYDMDSCHGLPMREARELVSARMLEEIGLSQRPDARPDELSAGELRRLALAAMLERGSRLLLADEPTLNLDDSGKMLAVRLFARARAQGTTLLIATRDPRLLQMRGARQLEMAICEQESESSGSSVA